MFAALTNSLHRKNTIPFRLLVPGLLLMTSAAVVSQAGRRGGQGTSDACTTAPFGRSVPVDVLAGRFFARWPLRQGGELRFYLDTGGGTNMLFPAAVNRLGVPTLTEIMQGDSMKVARFPRDIATGPFPLIGDRDSVMIRLLVPPPQWDMEHFDDSVRVDGLLGPPWFADRVWMFDYPGRALYHDEDGAAAGIPTQCWVPLGFQVDSAGTRTSHYPRIVALIDGDSVDFLFDSGAMTTVTDSAWPLVNPEQRKRRAASFITRDRFDQWHARHPDWLVVMQAEERFGAAMLRVPFIEIGGQRIGPVWFTSRPNASFHQFMSQWMDRRIDGALGGSAWHDLMVVIDYPGARVALLRPAAR